MTEDQLDILVFVIYLFTVLYIIELVLALYNIWTFLIKQGNYKTVPLLLFYILTVWLIMMRIYYSVWYFNVWINSEIVVAEYKNVLKINLGLVQCWLLYELSLRISESI